MRVLIIEDEGIAADRLERLLMQINSSIEVLAKLDSVRKSLEWFSNNLAPDLAFLDIQLADGKSFEILDKVQPRFPVIFTTAYDQYAIEAFRVNAVDYLLKPIVPEDLKTAVDRFKERQTPVINTDQIAALISPPKKYKERFVIKVGEHLKSVQVDEIKLIFSQDKATYVLTNSNQKLLVDYSLEQIEDLLDPSLFFRISRKYLVAVSGIADIISFSNSRLKLKVSDFDSEDLIVARERVGSFKDWLDR